MTVYDRIVTSVPVNRSAAVVASGGDAERPLTATQLRENLLPRLKQIEVALRETRSPRVRAQLVQEKIAIQDTIAALRPKKKTPGYASHFVEAARTLLSPAVFQIIRKEALRRVDAQPQEVSDDAHENREIG